MRKSVYFMCIVLQGALSASLPASKNPYQDVDSFKDMQADIKNQLSFGRHGAEVQLEDDTTELQDDEMDVQDEPTEVGNVASEVQKVPQSATLSSYVYYTMFSAYLSSDRCYHTGANFQFNIAPVNPYHRYNVNTGIYTALYTGYYVFTWTVAASHKSWFSAELRANGVLKGTVMADSDVNGSSGGIHPATGYVITQITANQHVYIRFVSGYGCGVKSNSRTRSTFSGWRIY